MNTKFELQVNGMTLRKEDCVTIVVFCKFVGFVNCRCIYRFREYRQLSNKRGLGKNSKIVDVIGASA